MGRKTVGATGLPRGIYARVGLLFLAGSLALGATACADGTSSTTNTHPTTTANGTAAANATGTSGTSTIPLPISTSAAQDGTSDYCAAPVNVSVQPPASLPQYPGAQLHISQNTNGNELFGYCATDSVSAIATFYAQHLPGSGWSNVQTNTISFLQQVTATQGSTHLVISVEPSATLQNTTEVLVVEQG